MTVISKSESPVASRPMLQFCFCFFCFFYIQPLPALFPLNRAINRLVCSDDFQLECFEELMKNFLKRGITWESNVVLLYLLFSLHVRVGPELVPAAPLSAESRTYGPPTRP